MNGFKDGDWIHYSEVKNHEQLKAMHAVCGLDIPEESLIWHHDLVFFSEQPVLQNFKSNVSLRGCGYHNITEWLFKGAPDWAVDLRYISNTEDYLWTDGDFNHKGVGEKHESTFNDNPIARYMFKSIIDDESIVIVTRDNNFTDINSMAYKMRNQPMKTPTWQSLNSFQWKSIESFCWIACKGKVIHCWYDGEGYFRFNEHSQSCYLPECILAVMPIKEPQLPKKEEVKHE